MKKFYVLSLFCLAMIPSMAENTSQVNDTVDKQIPVSEYQMLMPLQPTYHKNVTEAANWGSNWFIEVKGGASAFMGSPIGCGDVFDRITPAIQVGVGKWFTPAIGGRVEFQGLTFKNADFRKMHYKFIHADFMYNITSGFLVNDRGLSKWDVIPFIGVGMIHNSDWKSTCKCPGRASGSHPFAFSYGIEARYRVSDRVHAVAEVSGMTTAKNFDCVHPSSKFGDNMLTVSLGLSFSIGKTGWKRVIDAKPYIEENVYLRKLVTCFHNERDDIQKLFGGENSKITYPKNSYSGLLSLRSRLANTGKGSKIITDGDNDEVSQCSRHDSNGEDGMYSNDTTYFSTGKTDVGVPVYFFFRLNSDSLVDNSQLINLDEIALAAKQHGYRISITGAADSVTGTEKKNNELSRKRANYIASELVKRGIDKEKLHDHSLGGIDKYKPCEANRFSMVVLTR